MSISTKLHLKLIHLSTLQPGILAKLGKSRAHIEAMHKLEIVAIPKLNMLTDNVTQLRGSGKHHPSSKCKAKGHEIKVTWNGKRLHIRGF